MALALVIIALLAVAAPADAATVTRTFAIDPFGAPYGTGTVRFTGAPGEANQLEISFDAQGVTLTDAVNPITTTVCTQVDPRTVRCADALLSVVLGDGADTARVIDSRAAGALPIRLDAGAGADTVTGGPQAERIVDGGAGEADRFIGGGGSDQVSYAGRATRVRVVLGAPGEDVLDAITSVTGGSADDILIGDERANIMSGGPGDDRIEGGAGDDVLGGDGGDDRVRGGDGDDSLLGDDDFSQAGRDVLEGGAGDDWLNLSAADDEQLSIAGPTFDPLPDQQRDVARCGAGTDVTYLSESRDVERDCEAVDVDGVGIAHRLVRVSPSRVRLTVVHGPAADDFGVYLVPRRGSRTRLTRTARLANRTRVTLRLTAAGRRHLRRSRAVRIVIPSRDVTIDATVR